MDGSVSERDEAPTSNDKPNFAKYEKVHKEALARFERAKKAEAENRQEAENDIRFRNGDQWPQKIKNERGDRPTLTINRTDAFVRRVVNELRRNRPSIKVAPADSKASLDVARIMGGIVRNIERNSQADRAYDTAADQAVGSGFGHFRIVTEYCDEQGFQQDLRIKRIPNQFTVYSDPDANEADWADAQWRFVTELVHPDDFEDEYGFRPASFTEIGDNSLADWYDGEKVRVAEYWRIVTNKIRVYQMPDGQIVRGGKNDAEMLAALKVQGIVPRTREVEQKRVEQYMLTGEGVFKKGEWLGKFIPVVSVIGREAWIEGKRVIMSLIRHAKDPARMYNYWASMETEQVALQNKIPYLVPKGAIDDPDIRKRWESANVTPYPFLEFDVVNGMQPQRQPGPTLSDGAREGRISAVEDLKAVLDMQDPTMGRPITGDASGIAVREYKQQGDTATFDFTDNVAKAIRQCGRILVDLIPKIYDGPRIARMLNEDGTTQQVPVNQPAVIDGIQQIYDLRVGTYDVSVDVGPSYQTQREESREGQIALITAQPELAGVIGDLVIANMGWPQAEEMAARVRKSMDPSITGDALPPQVQQQMEQGKQMIAQLQDALQQAQNHIREQQFDVQKHAIDAKAKALSAQADVAKSTVDQQRIALERDKLGVDTVIARTKAAIDVMQLRVDEIKATAEVMGAQVDMATLLGELAQLRAQVEGLAMPAVAMPAAQQLQ